MLIRIQNFHRSWLQFFYMYDYYVRGAMIFFVSLNRTALFHFGRFKCIFLLLFWLSLLFAVCFWVLLRNDNISDVFCPSFSQFHNWYVWWQRANPKTHSEEKKPENNGYKYWHGIDMHTISFWCDSSYWGLKIPEKILQLYCLREILIENDGTENYD